MRGPPHPARTIGRRDLILGGAMLLTAGAAWARMPRNAVIATERPDIGDVIPTQVGAWGPAPGADLVLPPEDERAAAKVYEEEIQRSYARGPDDPAIMLVLAYDRSQSGMLMVHRPESCYPGSGFTITGDEPATIPLAPGLTVQGRFLSTQRDTRIEQVLYWTRLGDAFPDSWDAERQSLAFQNLRGIAPDGALVRLSMIDPDAQEAKAGLTRFAKGLYAASGREGRALLGGPANVGPERA